jgi:hypothetical protein
MGSLFGVGSILGDSSINGVNTNPYTCTDSCGGSSEGDIIGSPTDSSQYTDSGQDPTSKGGGLSSLSHVIDDAFKAFTISQTPTSYRAASPQSPAGILARTQASTAQTQSTILTIGAIVIVIVVLFLIFKK